MGRRQGEHVPRRPLAIFLLIAAVAGAIVYISLSSAMRRPDAAVAVLSVAGGSRVVYDVGGGAGEEGEEEDEEEEEAECCRGAEHAELWGAAVKWGTDHKFNTSKDCCRACRAMCGDDGPCLCDSWVFCGDRDQCGDKFGECWLKKQKDALFPALQESGEKVIWTSGLIFGKGEGIIGVETEQGTLNIKLLPHCSPNSVAYIAELLHSRHCAGCNFYRAEDRGTSWDSEGNHISDASLGPPYALIQGTLEAEGVKSKNIPVEACPRIKRGSVAWVGSGPEFFISLANHDEWKRKYTVFGLVLPEYMEIVEKIARLPTRSDSWNNINVSVLENPVRLRLTRATKSQGSLNLGESSKSE